MVCYCPIIPQFKPTNNSCLSFLRTLTLCLVPNQHPSTTELYAFPALKTNTFPFKSKPAKPALLFNPTIPLLFTVKPLFSSAIPTLQTGYQSALLRHKFKVKFNSSLCNLMLKPVLSLPLSLTVRSVSPAATQLLSFLTTGSSALLAYLSTPSTQT